MIKKLLFITVSLLGFATINLALAPTVVDAAGPSSCDTSNRFLLFKPWYYGITKDNPGDPKNSCAIKSPSEMGGKDTQENLQRYIWTIVLNVVEDMLIAVGYICVGFIMFGGFKYMRSTGDPGIMSEGKTIITNAIIGLMIAILSVAIVNVIAGNI